MNLKAIPLTQSGSWPYYTTIFYHSFGDAGGLFMETAGAVTEDVHADGVYDYTDAEFANISGDLHGKVFPTPMNSILTPYYMFSIKHGNDIGIVSPYCAASPTMPGKLQIYTYDAVHGMPTGSPTTVTFSAIGGTTVSVIVSLAKIGTKYHAIHLAYKKTVSGTAGEIAAWGVVHNADGSIESAMKIEETITYDTLRVPSTLLQNLGYATQNKWTIRIEKASTVWTSLYAQVHTHLHGNPGYTTTTVHEITIDSITYYEAVVTSYAVDAETPTISFRFNASETSTNWSSEYGFGEAEVCLDTSSSTNICYVERADKKPGYGIKYNIRNDDPKSWEHEAQLASTSDFSVLVNTLLGAQNIYYYDRPFLSTSVFIDGFVDLGTTDLYFHARARDCDGAYTAWSSTIHLALANNVVSVANRYEMNGDSYIGEAWDADYVKVVVTPWSNDALQNDKGFSKMQIRNIANADTLFTALHRLTSTVVAGELTETEEDELVAVAVAGTTQKPLTDTTSGGFYADSTMSGENGVSFLTHDWNLGNIFYHATFDDASPVDLGMLPLTPAWWATLDLKGTLCAVAVGYMGTVYHKPVSGVGDWQTIADSENVSMHYMSIDPWGGSFYFADEESGLILRYVVVAQKTQSNAIWFQE